MFDVLKYREYEKEVYDWLMSKHTKDHNFTFSLRQKSAAGCETDYFIGTSKSNYFGTTFWTFPASYPGSSGDRINLIFRRSERGFSYFFEFTQTNHPHNEQNKLALHFLQAVEKPLNESIELESVSGEENKIYSFKTKSLQTHYSTVQQMLDDIDKQLPILISVVDAVANDFKENNPALVFERINMEKFKRILKKKDDRLMKFEGIHSDMNFEESAKVYSYKEEITEPSSYPLNQILYGPPGTGKTYHTVLEAAKIVLGKEDISYDEALKIFNENLGSQIEFITFHQNYSYEDFIQGLRPDITNGNALTFEKKEGVFKRIADRALFEYYIEIQKVKSRSVAVYLNVNEVYLDFYNSLFVGQEFLTKANATIKLIQLNENKNIVFKYENGNKPVVISSNRVLKLFDKVPDINLIKNVNEDVRAAIGGCDATIYYTILREFIEFYEENKSRIEKEEDYQDLDYLDITEKRKKEILSQISLDEIRTIAKSSVKNYVIIIDEINRANISRVFGELITLIEEDKRSHGKIPMRVTLPSGDSFIVPSNLYIIGTMNTADKSIALLDIALRRRFEFIAMYPDLNVDGVNDREVLEAINKAILDRKNHDFTIGHSYFMRESYSREKTINNKVIPLLLEYFMNDEREVIAIMKEANLTVGDWPLKLMNQND